MDDAVHRFRRQVGRELGDREGAERRYSVGLRQQAVAYWQTREAAGDGLRAVATALGIAPVTVVREDDEHEEQPKRDRRHDEQVGGHDLARVIRQKRSPGW